MYRFLDTIRNTYDFFALYASIDGFDPEEHDAPEGGTSTVLDRWLASRLGATTKDVTEALDGYDVVSATAALGTFVDDLSNWYVRLSRRRFWRGGMEDDKIAAYRALRGVLLALCKLLAPFTPFLSESIYANLRTEGDPESVHLCAYPVTDEAKIDAGLEAEMAFARRVVALGHQARNQAGIRVRQPLSRVVVRRPKFGALSDGVAQLIAYELNVEVVESAGELEAFLGEVAVPNFRSLGPRLGPKGQAAANWIKAQDAATLRAQLDRGSVSVEVDGGTVEILPEDVSFEEAVTDEWVDVSEGDCRILLNVAIDERLRERGRLRELTHRIQLARKEAGFEVTDRIELGYVADAKLGKAVEANRDEIAAEVLATTITEGVSGDEEHTEVLNLDGETITIGLSRASNSEES